MHKLFGSLLTGTTLLMLALPAHGQISIDQDNPGSPIGNFGNLFNWSAMSFQQASGNIAGAGIYLTNNGGDFQGNIILNVWDARPDQTGATQIAGGSAAANLASGAAGWVDVFWTAAGVTPGTSLYLTIFSPEGHFHNHYTSTSQPGTYANGGAYYNYSSVETANYTDFTNYDLEFRTYTDASGPTGTVTPEPVSMALLGTGLVGLGGVARRRRKKLT